MKDLQTVSEGIPRLLWKGPGIHLTDVPAAAFSHLPEAVVQPRQVR